ncbi:MAG: hypothetical protein WD377_09610 [Nitriliruptoraceae bacterium]
MIQDFLQLPVVILVRVLLGMVLAFVVLPNIVLPRPPSARTSLDATVVRSVRWTGIILAVSHVLLVVRLFHVLPILLLCAYGWLRKQDRLPSRKRVATDGVVTTDAVLAGDVSEFDEMPERSHSAVQRAWLQFTDMFSVFERVGFRMFVDWIVGVWRRLLGLVRSVFTRQSALLAVLVAPIVGILSASLVERGRLAFRFETLSPPEAYVYLTWAKSFANNSAFPDGIYPQGLPGFIAFLGKLTPGIDLYEITRYTGALIGMLLVFGIFYAVLRLTANVGAALFAAGAFGIFGTVQQWHSPWIRQTGPLPQELGFAIALLALPSAILAITERDRDHLRTTMLAALGIGIIHPVPLAMFIVFAFAGALVTAVIDRGGFDYAFFVLVYGLIGGLIAHVYVPIGLLVGLDIFQGMDHPFTVRSYAGGRTEALVGLMATERLGHNLLTYVAMGSVALALLVALVMRARSRTRHIGAQLAGLAGFGIVALALYDVRPLQIPLNLLGPMGNLVGIAVALALGAGFAAVTAAAFAVRNPLQRAASVIVLAAVAVAGFGRTFDTGPLQRAPSEYEAMAAVTRDVMRNQDAFTFTIVGTPQQRQAVAGVGTFIELWVFARDVTVRDAQDPGFVVPDVSSLMFARDLGQTLPIPTADVYIFVEKDPFPVPEQAPVGPTEEYYYNREKRGRIMATVYAWAEYYRHYHTDMTVHFEDDDVVVYRIRRRPNTVASAAAPQFKDYTWEPGVLFTGGPAEPSEVVIPWES